MHRRLFVALIATITFSIVFLNGNLNVAAKSVQDYETEIKELDEKKNKAENKKNKITNDKKTIKGKKDRLRSIQGTGGDVNYISVILGSQNFNDLITRSSAVNSIMDQDKSIMEENERDQIALSQKQEEVEEKKETLETKHKEQKEQKDSLVSLKSQ